MKTRHAREIRMAIEDARAGRWIGRDAGHLIPSMGPDLYWAAWNRATRQRIAKGHA